MRLCCTLLLVVFAVISLAFSNAAPTTSREFKPLHVDTPSREVPVTGDSSDNLRNRLLRVGSDSAERLAASSIDDEDRIGLAKVKETIRWLWDVVKMKMKMKFWLYSKTTPEKVYEKLKVTQKTDENFKYYSKYFFKYYVKYPDRQPSNLPTKVKEDIMKARLSDWLDNNLAPPEVFTKLGFTGTVESARGQQNYKYYEQYSTMWNNLQVRLKNPGRQPSSLPAKIDEDFMKARLTDYLDDNLTPLEVFTKLGFTGTVESARGKSFYKYYEQYSTMWSDLQVRLKNPGRQPSNLPAKIDEDVTMERLISWLKDYQTPPEVFTKLGFTGTFASARGQPNYEYFELYSSMWSALQVKLAKAMNDMPQI